jgi:hypothetical protein
MSAALTTQPVPDTGASPPSVCLPDVETPSESATSGKPEDVGAEQLPRVATGEFAAAMAGAGYAIFPCRLVPKSGGNPGFDKPPTTIHGFKDATTDPDEARRLWSEHPGSLLAIATGEASNIVVIDLDGHKHPEAQKWFERNAVWFEGAYTYETVSGGKHYVFAYPDAETLADYWGGIRSRAGKLAPGVDVRGNGGYAIYYAANGLPSSGEIKPVPPGLLEQLLACEMKINLGDDRKERKAAGEPGDFDKLPRPYKLKMVSTCLEAIGASNPTLALQL